MKKITVMKGFTVEKAFLDKCVEHLTLKQLLTVVWWRFFNQNKMLAFLLRVESGMWNVRAFIETHNEKF